MAATHIARALTPAPAARMAFLGLASTKAFARKTTATTAAAAIVVPRSSARLFHAFPARRATNVPPPPPAETEVSESSAEAASSATPFASSSTPAPPNSGIDWSASFHGLSTVAFSAEVAAKLMAPINPEDVEIKPDGIIYLPEIKYRRILNAAFGPGGWGLAPRGELAVGEKIVSREFALVVQGRYVGQARGECPYFGPDTVATAGEGCKSNALMRCSKDLGIASELWDPRFIRKFRQDFCREVWVEHVATKKRRQIWLRKDCPPAYPYALPSANKMVR